VPPRANDRFPEDPDALPNAPLRFLAIPFLGNFDREAKTALFADN
jgi:hypothetical protein